MWRKYDYWKLLTEIINVWMCHLPCLVNFVTLINLRLIVDCFGWFSRPGSGYTNIYEDTLRNLFATLTCVLKRIRNIHDINFVHRPFYYYLLVSMYLVWFKIITLFIWCGFFDWFTILIWLFWSCVNSSFWGVQYVVSVNLRLTNIYLMARSQYIRLSSESASPGWPRSDFLLGLIFTLTAKYSNIINNANHLAVLAHPNILTIHKYFTNFPNCVASMRGIYSSFICLLLAAT